LVFDLDNQVARIFDFIDVKNDVEDQSFQMTNSHELFGNSGLKSDKKKNSSVVYDCSWMRDMRFSLYSIFLIPVGVFASYFAKKSQ
jgi:hypothetical protein